MVPNSPRPTPNYTPASQVQPKPGLFRASNSFQLFFLIQSDSHVPGLRFLLKELDRHFSKVYNAAHRCAILVKAEWIYKVFAGHILCHAVLIMSPMLGSSHSDVCNYLEKASNFKFFALRFAKMMATFFPFSHRKLEHTKPIIIDVQMPV